MKFVVTEKFNQGEYVKTYMKENVQQIKFTINKKTEGDLLKWVNYQDNKQGYIKNLIREDMEKRMFTVKDEFVDMWFGSEMPEPISMAEICRLSEEWEKDLDELMGQVVEV